MLNGVLWLNFTVYIILVFFAVIIVHCALHHIIYKLFDRSLFKGIGYAGYNSNEDSLRIINSYQYALIELLPLVIVSIACTFIPGWIGQIAFACNILVSIGDVYNLLEIIRSKNYNYVKADESNHVNDVKEINI
jgi:C4-dicarboxylate transporter